jgi:hypothetical protein
VLDAPARLPCRLRKTVIAGVWPPVFSPAHQGQLASDR